MNLQEMFTPRNVMYGAMGAAFIWAILTLGLGLDAAHSYNPENPEGLLPDPENPNG